MRTTPVSGDGTSHRHPRQDAVDAARSADRDPASRRDVRPVLDHALCPPGGPTRMPAA